MIKKIANWVRQKRCCHRYKKHWNKETAAYEYRCVHCGKVR